MLIKSNHRNRIQPLSKKPCCSGCREGKPCCGSQPRFENHSGLWLPDTAGPAKLKTVRQRMTRLDLPQWPRDRKFLLQVERLMPIRFTRMKYGDPVRWKRQLQTVKNLLTLPPDQWDIGGLRGLPAYMPAVQFDMTCTGCCGVRNCCCDDPPPATLFVTLTAGGGSCSTCNGGNSLAVLQSVASTEICPNPSIGSFLYEQNGAFFCACEFFGFECTSSSGGAGGDVAELSALSSSDGAVLEGEITSCNPFEASGTLIPIAGIDLMLMCGDDGTIGETFSFVVTE